MAVSIRQIHPVFVGEVSGVDLRRPLSREEVAAIEAGMDRYAVLVFHDQDITDAQQIAFTRNFGEIENSAGGNVTKANQKRLDPLMNDVSNLGEDNRPLARDDRRRLFNLGNQLWHSDSSFRAIPAKYSILSGRTVAKNGGNTEFADMRAAYDALDDETKALIEDRVCGHSLMYSRGQLGFEITPEERMTFRPVRQRLVRTHPVTQIALSGVACRHDRRLAGARSPRAASRSDGTRGTTAIRLCPPLAAIRPCHVGQPADDAPGAPFRRERDPRHAAHHRRRRRADSRAGRGGLSVGE